MKLTFNFRGRMSSSKRVANTCGVIKIDGRHFTCKTANKHLNV